MNKLFQMTIDDYIEICELAKAHGKQPGDRMDEELSEVMEKKGIKPFGMTELSKEELAKEYASHGKSILDISTNSEGVQKYTVIKKEEKT